MNPNVVLKRLSKKDISNSMNTKPKVATNGANTDVKHLFPPMSGEWYSCTVCNRKYKYKSAIAYHMKQAHGIKSEDDSDSDDDTAANNNDTQQVGVRLRLSHDR